MENILDQIFYNVNFEWGGVSEFLRNGFGGLSYVRHPIAQNVIERYINRTAYLFTEDEVIFMGTEMEGAKTESIIEFAKVKIEDGIKIPMHPSFDRFIDVLPIGKNPNFIDEYEYLERKIELGRFDKVPVLILLERGYCSDAEIDRFFTDFDNPDGLHNEILDVVRFNNCHNILSKLYDKISNFSAAEFELHKCKILDIFQYRAFVFFDNILDGTAFIELKTKDGESFWVYEYIIPDESDGARGHYFLNGKILPLCS